MKHAALNLLGVLTGLTLGWIAVATPLAAVFAPARVTWDATGCPAGIYTITSTAQKLGSGETFVATSTNVQLPQPTFIQEFANLPNGAYSVSASVQGTDGAAFRASTQTIQASETGVTQIGAFNSGHRGTTQVRSPIVGSRGHQRPTSAQSSGYASALAAAGTKSSATPRPIVTGPTVTSQERSLIEIRRFLDLAGEVDWRRIEVLDTDGDGVIDQATIELAAGEIYILMVRGG